MMVSLVTRGAAAADNRPLLERLAESPRPAVVQYPGPQDPDERIELSGRVLVNWAAKTANLLDVEGLSSGLRLTVDLPAGWKSLAISLGALWAGAELVFAAEPGVHTDATDGLLTDRPESWPDYRGVLVAVSSGATDTEFSADIAPDLVDYSAEVRHQADQFLLPSPDLSPASVVGLMDDAASDVETTPGGTLITAHERGTAVAAGSMRLGTRLLHAAITAWEGLRPVVLVPALSLDSLPDEDHHALVTEGITL